MDYPTLQDKLIMPEYGRNIQKMVAHALTITDRDERTRCARTIIHTMGHLCPHLRDVNDLKHKLWDHLALLSGFRLDIDYPYEQAPGAPAPTPPEPLYRPRPRIRYPHYGRVIEDMIAKAVSMEAGEQKDHVVLSIANQMKKNFMLWNKDVVDDRKILQDLCELSGGRIRLEAENLRLLDSREILSKKPGQPHRLNINPKRRR